MPTFTTTLLAAGGNNVGIELPDDVVAALGGVRVPVTVTVDGHTYRSRTAVMGGRHLIGVNAAERAASGLAAGEEHEVTVEVDTAPRTVEVPEDLARALADAGLRDAFDVLAPSRRKEHVRQVEEAKAAATRERRVTRVVDSLS